MGRSFDIIIDYYMPEANGDVPSYAARRSAYVSYYDRRFYQFDI
ncbi:MAG: hypothetical protein R3C68_10355 [Myxococcota bacterium]